MVQLLAHVHRLNRLAVVFKAHASKRSFPYLLLLLRLLVVLEELGLSVQIERRPLLACHVVAGDRLVYLIVAARVLSF